MAAVAQPRDAEITGRRFKVTRAVVFAVLFMLAAALIVLVIVPQIAANAQTTVVFGDGVQDLTFGTVGYLYLVAGAFFFGGLFRLVPASRTLRGFQNGWLIFNGILIALTVLVLTATNGSFNMTQMLQSSFRLMTPIAIGAIAGMWCERSGVVNIAIEGMMLTGACMGFVTVALIAPYLESQQNALWLGVAIAVVAGGLMALLHAWLAITFRIDQVVSGTVINILALGITSFLRREILLSNEASRETLNVIEIPILSDIPVLGDVFFTGKPIYLTMFFLIVLTHVILFYTKWGLRTRAVGENPHAADTLGINVYRNRYINVVIGGMIAGLGGAWFSLEFIGTFDDNMIGGKGFIALAAMIFGKWTPFGAAVGALLFGFAEALNLRFQIAGVPIPPQFIQMTPYILTIIVLAGLVGRAVAPKADGVPYEKE